MISAEEFNKFCEIAKKHGVKTMRVDGLQVEFNEVPDPTLSTAHTLPNVPLTDEQMILWSTDHMPETKED